MTANYWDRYARLRSSRRGFLGGAAAAGAGATGLILAGCGSSKPSSTATAASGSPATATASGSPRASSTSDPYASAKRGGTINLPYPGDPPTLDPYKNISYLTEIFAGHVYTRLLRFTNTWDTPPAQQTPTAPDTAISYESPDSTHYTFALRPNMKFQNVSPVSGRAVSTEDIKYSWSRLVGPTSPNRSQVSFIDHLEYPDASHITFVLKSPNADFLAFMADPSVFWIMPTESESQFNPATTAIGAGPWILDKYTPSSTISWKRNPDWYDSPRPYADGLTEYIIAAYATQKAEFLAGKLDQLSPDNLDLPTIKNSVKGAQFFGEVVPSLTIVYFDNHPDSPWVKDDRVRLALSMSLDRESILAAISSSKTVEQAGLQEKTAWNNILPAGATQWWLDPKGSAMGPNARYFQYDGAEAKKLLSAAGYPNGFTAKYQYTNVYPPAYGTNAEANIQFFQEVGVKVNTEVQNYQSQYFTHTFVGDFTGIAFGPESTFPEIGSYPQRLFTPNPVNHGHINDPQLVSLANQQQQELDPVRRKQLLNQIQQYHAGKMYYIPNAAGGSTGWAAYQPWIEGANHVVTGTYAAASEVYPYWWINKS